MTRLAFLWISLGAGQIADKTEARGQEAKEKTVEREGERAEQSGELRRGINRNCWQSLWWLKERVVASRFLEKWRGRSMRWRTLIENKVWEAGGERIKLKLFVRERQKRKCNVRPQYSFNQRFVCYTDFEANLRGRLSERT